MPISHVAAPAQSIAEPLRSQRTPFALTLARQRAALVALALVAFALRLFTLDAQSLWRDEVDAIWFALRPLEQTVAMFTQMAQNGPLYFLSLRPWLQLLGSSEFALRLPSAMAGVAAVPLLWQVGRRLVGNGVAPLLAALFLVINPYALWYGQEGKMYTIITFLALLASWCWLRAMEGSHAQDPAAAPKWRWWLGYVVAISLAMYFHLLAILIIPLHMIWFVIALPTARRQWKGYALALAALTLPYVPMLLWQWRMLLAPGKVTGFNYTPLSEMLKTILLNQARGFMPGDPLLWMAPIYFVGVVGLLLGFTEMRNPPVQSSHERADNMQISPGRRFLMLVAWAVVPVLSIWVISLRQPVFTDRYIIWMLPAALLLVALGVEVVRANLGRLGLPVALLLVGYVAGFWLYAGWQQTSGTIKYDLRSAIQYVAQQRDPHTLLILQIPHLEYAYRYYSSDMGADPFAGSDARLGAWVGGLWTNGGADLPTATAEVESSMRALTENHGALWLILSEPDMWDGRHLMEAWLEHNAEVADAQDYHGVRVRHYTLH